MIIEKIVADSKNNLVLSIGQLTLVQHQYDNLFNSSGER